MTIASNEDEIAHPNGTTTGRRLGTRAAAVLAAAALVSGATLAVTPSADAATVRSGARWGQVDILLDGVETRRAATSLWGSSTTCWSVATAGASTGSLAGKALVGRWLVGGGVGAVAGGLGCVSVMSVCAAQAQVAGRWAGITVTPTGFWCWKY